MLSLMTGFLHNFESIVFSNHGKVTLKMKPLAKNVRTMPSSGIRMIMHKSMDIPNVLHLEAGQPNFATPLHIIEAAYQGALDGYTRYTANAGLISLREAIAEKVTKVNGIPATCDNIVVTVGSVAAVTTTLLTLVDPGDEVLAPDPCWPNYTMAIACCGAVKTNYPCYEVNEFVPDIKDVEKCCCAQPYCRTVS